MLKTQIIFLSRWWPVWLSLFGFLFFSIASFPGYMSPDSFDQYHQSLTRTYTDWHPPVMAWMWFILNYIFHGPEGLLFYHLGLFWVSILLFYLRFKEHKGAWMFFVVGFLPWIANFEGTLWKDMGLAFSLLLAIALIISKPQRKIFIVLSVFCLMYAFMVRHNSIFAIAPILIFLIIHFYPQLRLFTATIIACFCLLLCSLFSSYFTYSFLSSAKKHPFVWVMDNDLIHISLDKRHSFFPGVSLELLEKCEIPSIQGSRECLNNEISYRTIGYDGERKIWLETVKNHPKEYLRYRFQAFFHLMRRPAEAPYEFSLFAMGDNNLGIIQNKKNLLRNIIKGITHKTAKALPFLFKPYFWLLLSLVFIVKSFSFKGDKQTVYLIRALLLSSLFYILGYIPTANSADFRYIYWSIIAINFAIVIYLIGKEKSIK